HRHADSSAVHGTGGRPDAAAPAGAANGEAVSDVALSRSGARCAPWVGLRLCDDRAAGDLVRRGRPAPRLRGIRALVLADRPLAVWGRRDGGVDFDNTPRAMTRSPREHRIYILSILCAAVPFAFGLARAFRTGTDFRYLWLAIVAALGTAAVIVLGKACSPTAVVAQSAATFVVATLLAALTAFSLGARAGPG